MILNPVFILLAALGLARGPALLPYIDDVLRPEPVTLAEVDAAEQDTENVAPPEDEKEETGGEPVREDPVYVLLGTLEKAGADLKSFTANVFYEEEDALVGDIVRRKGEVIYRNPAKPETKSFAILFNERIAGGRKRTQLKHYIFSGRWFVEVDHDQKRFFKYEVVAPGEAFDPLKLGEGPFPLPIGQARKDVLERFDVMAIELPEDGPLRKLRDRGPVDGLRLTPKPGVPAAEDYKYFELFWDQKTRLPVGVHMIKTNGNRKTARLDDIKRNPELDEATRAKLSVETPDGDWRVEVKPLERAGEK